MKRKFIKKPGAQKRRRKDDDGEFTISGLKKDCWDLFSRFIRTRDCQKTTGTFWHGTCVTCDKDYPIGKLQAGHFIQGRSNAVLFDEEHVHGQCQGCNMFKGGMPLEYMDFMVQTFGLERVQAMRDESKRVVHFTREDLEGILGSLAFKLEALNPGDDLLAKMKKRHGLQ